MQTGSPENRVHLLQEEEQKIFLDRRISLSDDLEEDEEKLFGHRKVIQPLTRNSSSNLQYSQQVSIMANTQRINALASELPSEVSLKFKYISNELKEMGFDMKKILSAILLSQTTTVEAALEYLIKEPNGWTHPFTPSNDNPLLCEGCREAPNEHVGSTTPQ